jgi:hypothetical protein
MDARRVFDLAFALKPFRAFGRESEGEKMVV